MEKKLAENGRYVEYGTTMVCPKCGETITQILEIHRTGVTFLLARTVMMTCPKCRVILGSYFGTW